MKTTILQGQIKLEPQTDEDASALGAMDRNGVRIVSSEADGFSDSYRMMSISLGFSPGPDSPWRRISEDPPPDGEYVLLMYPSPRDLFPKRGLKGAKLLEYMSYEPIVVWNKHPGSCLPDDPPTHWAPCPKPFPEFRGATAVEPEG